MNAMKDEVVINLSVTARIKRQQMKKQAKYTDTMLMELGLKSNKDKILQFIPCLYFYNLRSHSHLIISTVEDVSFF
jgi:hypothetical protein